MRSLLAMEQALDESVPARWMALAEKVATVYDTIGPRSARRWACAGTSIGSSRFLNDIAQRLAEQLIAQAVPADALDEISVFLGPPEWPLEQTLSFLSEQGVFEDLLELPKTFGCWKSTGTRHGASPCSNGMAGTGWWSPAGLVCAVGRSRERPYRSGYRRFPEGVPKPAPAGVPGPSRARPECSAWSGSLFRHHRGRQPYTLLDSPACRTLPRTASLYIAAPQHGATLGSTSKSSAATPPPEGSLFSTAAGSSSAASAGS
jgi:hypothetical protein